MGIVIYPDSNFDMSGYKEYLNEAYRARLIPKSHQHFPRCGLKGVQGILKCGASAVPGQLLCAQMAPWKCPGLP